MGDLAASRRGPEERFRSLFDDHYAIVLAFARRRIDASNANDVVSETFTVAWRRLDDVPTDRDRQVAWLLGTARRVLANTFRSRRRQRALERRIAGELGARPAKPDPDGDADEVEAVRSALAGLAAADRDVLGLTAWEGLSHAQIGEILGVSPGAVSMRLQRARERLAAALDRGPDGGGA